MGRLKEFKEDVWSKPTNHTIYQWTDESKTKKGLYITKTTEWTNIVHNRIRQTTGYRTSGTIARQGSLERQTDVFKRVSQIKKTRQNE